VKRPILGVLLVLTFVAVGIAAAPPLTFTFSDVHANKTATQTDSYAVNNAGVIAGDYVDSSNVEHGMILAGKKLTTANNKKCQTTGNASGSISFFGINSAGAVVGWCNDVNTGLADAFMYAKGKFVAIKYPKSMGTQANGINDKGEIVGMFIDNSGNGHGFLFANKKYTKIDVKGASSTSAWGINNAGTITVYTGSLSSGSISCSSSTPCASYVLKGKKLTKVSPPKAGSIGVVVHTPNNKGDIDGTYFDSNGSAVGFLLHGGKYFDVSDPKGNLPSTRNDGLNDKLEMVGRYSPTDGTNHGFKVTTK
jgi:probable HAF family extracellular repeat protein